MSCNSSDFVKFLFTNLIALMALTALFEPSVWIPLGTEIDMVAKAPAIHSQYYILPANIFTYQKYANSLTKKGLDTQQRKQLKTSFWGLFRINLW